MTGEYEGEGAAKMSQKDQHNGTKDNIAIRLLVRPLEESQIADEECNLEKADADLVNGASCKVDSCVRNQIGRGSVLDRQSQSISCFCVSSQWLLMTLEATNSMQWC